MKFAFVGQIVKLRAGCQPALQAGCQPAAIHPAHNETSIVTAT
jgi:hypothetical protein